MKRTRAIVSFFFWLCLVLPVVGADKPVVVELWPGKVPDETDTIGPEKVRMSPKLTKKEVEVTESTKLLTNVTKPTITLYRPAKDKDTGAAVIIGGRVWLNCAHQGPLPRLAAVIGVGFKWLCDPYGTGFDWMRPEMLQSLVINQAYWLAQMTADDLGQEEGELRRPEGPPTARRCDVFGTANFFNFKPWAAAIEYLLAIGIESIAEHDQRLVERILDGLDPRKYDVLSPRESIRRSTLVFLSHKERDRNRRIYDHLRDKKIDVAYRRGMLRLAPHLYNTIDDIDRTLTLLHGESFLPFPGE
jgi:hypothetical protein